MKRTVLLTVFHRAGSHVIIGSQDMQAILCRHGECMNHDPDRWDEAAGEWAISEDEAFALAGALALQPQLPGTNLVSVRYSPDMTGTEMCSLDDGLTATARAASLISFLRGGACRWRFITDEDRAKQFPNDHNAS